MTDQKPDELATVQEELAALKRAHEAGLQELDSRVAAITGLEKAVADKDGEIAGLKQALTDCEGKLADTGTALAQAVGEYKTLALVAQPGIPAELITGSTIAEVYESLRKARVIIERVKQEMEAEVTKTRVPAGAPQRTPLDVSALSPREKIQYAIGSQQK